VKSINATGFRFQIDGGTQTFMGLSMETLEDRTQGKGHTATKFRQISYDVHPIFGNDNAENSIFGFSMADHEVRHVKITRMSWAAIVSQIGGLFPAAIALLWLVFAKSGFVNAAGKELYICKYLPTSLKLKYLRSARPNDLIHAEMWTAWDESSRNAASTSTQAQPSEA